ncbi:MAG: gluconate 2-dehydrogenase subunit 3 family protein [Gemmatimonadetes bacterium]|nr:gluconate 2-dehydrogenase subunit 3 family protein [Gemmatimonadota bacterium]
MDRREAIRRVSAMLGGAAFIGGTSLLAACSKEPAAKGDTAVAAAAPAPMPEPPLTMFTAEEVAYLDEIAETILPATSTPGAKDAKTGRFIGVMVQDCYTKEDQAIFKAGMTTLNDACTKAHGHGFMQASPEERLSLLTQLDKDAKAYQDKKKGDQPNHYFRMIKELTLLGFFTSEVGMTKVLRYQETPGRFDPCEPYTKGQTIYASHA